MTTINFTIDDTVSADVLAEIKLRSKNDSITIELFLTNYLKNLSRRCRMRAVDVESMIDKTGL